MKNIIQLFLILFTLSTNLFAQADNIKFNHLTVENGLSESKVQCILKDRYGFMWFGTGYNGLNRYDGYKFVIYKNDPNDPHSLSNNIINNLFEDHEGNLWIGTIDGLSLYDRKLDRFIVYQNNVDNPVSPNYSIHGIYQDREGALWIGTENGLDCFNPSTSTFVHYRYDPLNPNTISNNFIWDITEDDLGRLWIGTQGGLNALDEKTKKITRYINDPSNPHSLSNNSCSKLYKDNEGNIWILTLGGGLNRLNLKTEIFTRYQHNESNPNSISVNRGYGLAGDGEGNLFIGTENGGLNVFDTKTGRFTHYIPDIDNPASISSFSCPAVYYDAEGTLWVGTENGGVNFSSPYLQRFIHVESTKKGLNSPIVLGCMEDRWGNVWICTDGGGLNYWDRKTNRFSNYRCNSKYPASLGSDAVLTIFEDSRDRLWVGTYLGGLNLFDRSTGRFTRFLHNPQDSKSLPNNNVRKIFEDHQKNLWVATDNGLVRMNPDGRTFTSISDICKSNLNMTNLTALVEDKEGKLWVGGYGINLYCIDPNQRTVDHYQNEPNNPKSLKSSNVLSLYIDSKDNLWVGTNYGLDRFKPKDRTFDHFTQQDGLPDNKIVSLLEDGQGNLWIGTAKGLSIFKGAIQLTPKPEFHNYDISDGLQGGEFRVGSCFKTKSGEMLFGGNNGFNIFNPDRIINNSMVPRVVLTNFKIFNKDVPIGEHGSPLQQQIGLSDSLEFSYANDVITFEFSALNFLLPEKNQYAYKMEGFEKEWNYVGTKHTATYTNLDPGEYVFRVKASNNDGIWNEEGTAIRITITPPWWQTLWFRVILLAVMAGVVFWVYKWRVQARDLAAQRRMDTALTKERNLLRTLIDNIPDAIYVKDTAYRKTIANLADVHNIGLRSETEVLGKDDFELFPKELAEGFVADDRTVIQTGQPVINREEYVIDEQGQKRWLVTSKIPLRDEEGQTIGLVGIGRDITERKKAEVERERLIAELQDALADVKLLSGLVPICASCKKIRDDQGYWTQIESYIQDRSDAKFSHSICPDCAAKLYPNYNIKK